MNDVVTFFYEHPIFRYEEFEGWKRRQGTTNPSSIHSALRHYTHLERIKLLRRKLYGVITPNESKETAFFDPYLIAAKGSIDSVLAYHTALALHGIAYSSFEQFTFITSQKIKPFEINSQWYQPVAIPTGLKNANLENIGIQILERQGVEIKVTNLARTYVDVINRPDLGGGWEEVCRSISKIAFLNIEDVISYCLILQNATLVAKVGFFLEQRKGAFAAGVNAIDKLQQFKPTTAQYMGERDKEDHRLVKKWNLMVPISVLKQTWDEPDYAV